MQSLLVGNGINIQFDKYSYTTQQIVLRILKNCERDDFPSHIIVDDPYLLKNYIGKLYLEAREIVEGKYDSFAFGTAEIESLESFKKRYSEKIKTLRITDIGFEDYYLIHDVMCHKLKMRNPEQYNVREALKVAYFYAIYNDGNLDRLFKLYPHQFVDYLLSFNSIFTTNYDSNLESATGKLVFHIHGQFDKKADIYDATSFRNQLPDSPIKDIKVDDEYFYLYSNALSTHCGQYKEFQVKQHSSANSFADKMASAYFSDSNIRKEVDNWSQSSNKITANMGHAIQLKAAHPELCFPEEYHFDKLKAISGTLEILGLSPWNDFHIFESIDNGMLEQCVYYYFNPDECDVVKGLLPNLNSRNKIICKPVIDFWRECYEK